MNMKVLNPKLWDNDKLKPEVKSKITEIVTEFIEYIGMDIDVLDIHIVGSNAGYNYTANSDLDIHVIINYDDVEASKEVVGVLCNLEKAMFSRAYDIKIRGIEVELYIEDINTTTVSNGIYSVYKDRWVKHPTPEDASDVNIEVELSKIRNVISKASTSGDKNKIKSILNQLYLLRKNAISRVGEHSKGNMIFKTLRNEGTLDGLKTKLRDIMSRELSLEQTRINRKKR